MGVTKFNTEFFVVFFFFSFLSGPSQMDFGQVCIRSVSARDLTLVNNLDIYIHVVVEVKFIASFNGMTTSSTFMNTSNQCLC